MKKRNTRLTFGMVRSAYTKIVYFIILEDGVPKKLWPVDSVSDAGKDIISTLVAGYDYGYDIEFQFPITLENGDRKLVPAELTIPGEPADGAKAATSFNKKKTIQKESFWDESSKSDVELVSDKSITDFIKASRKKTTTSKQSESRR